ncbi:unknown [Phascolarctobacterium sp. CAG:266]|nr:unknown [Phascolarctobacterium sp. CAG:266]
MVEKEIVNNIENNDYFIWYDRTEIENLIKDKSFTWYSTVYCTFYSKPNFLWNPYKECFSLRIPLAWLCEHTNDNYIKEKISNEYKENIIDFKNYKIEGKNIDGLFSRSFSQISSKNLADYIRFLSRDTTYNAVNDYGQQRNYTAEEIKTNFGNFVSRYFSNKNKLYKCQKRYENNNWLSNVVSLGEIFKLYIIFTGASIDKEDVVFDKTKSYISDDAVTGIVEKILNSDRDITSVFRIDDSAYISKNSYYLEKLYTVLCINFIKSIDEFKEIADTINSINEYLENSNCIILNYDEEILKNVFESNDVKNLKYSKIEESIYLIYPKEEFNFKKLSDSIKSPLLTFIIIFNSYNILKRFKIKMSILKLIKNINVEYTGIEKIYSLKNIAAKVNACYSKNKVSGPDFKDLFNNTKVLSRDEQNQLLKFIFEGINNHKQRKEIVNLVCRHMHNVNAIYCFILMKSRYLKRVDFLDYLYLLFVYFRIYKKNIPVLNKYREKEKQKKVDGKWREIINKSKNIYDWLEVENAAGLFEVYFNIWERLKNKQSNDKTWKMNHDNEVKSECKTFEYKKQFLDSVIENLKKW